MQTLTLKAIKISKNMSEETLAFTANVYLNNRKIGSCKNEGMGGPTNVYLDKKGQKFNGLARSFVKRFKDDNKDPRYDELYDDVTDDTVLEYCCDCIANSYEHKVDVKRYKNNHTAFITKERYLSAPLKNYESADSFKSAIKKEHPQATFASDLTHDELERFLTGSIGVTEYKF